MSLNTNTYKGTLTQHMTSDLANDTIIILLGIQIF